MWLRLYLGEKQAHAGCSRSESPGIPLPFVYAPNALFFTFGCPRPAAGCSRALGCGAHRRAACTPRRKYGSRPGSVARALGVQSRAIRQEITGSLSTSPSLSGQWKPHKILKICSAAASYLYHTVPQALKLSTWWQPRYKSSRTSSSLPFAAAVDRRSVLVRVCAMFPDLGNRNEHIISREVQLTGCCAGGRTTITHTSSGFQKATGQPRYTHYNSSSGTTATALQTLAFAAATVLLCSFGSAQVLTRRHCCGYTQSW